MRPIEKQVPRLGLKSWFGMTALRKSAVNARRKAKGEERTANSEQRPLSRVGVEQPDQPEGQHGDHGRCGDGENPGPHDAGGNSPAHSRETLRSSDTDNSAGDGVRGADRNSGQCCAKESDGAGGLGAEAVSYTHLTL